MVLNAGICQVVIKYSKQIEEFSMNIEYVHGLIGGMLIGTAAVMLYWFNGRIMGVSGIASKLLTKPDKEYWWRLSFFLGLISVGFIYRMFLPVKIVINVSGGMLIIAGLLVGFGTVIGNGCTSGHGICGMARLSKRSIVATIVFMVTAMLTVLVKRILGV